MIVMYGKKKEKKRKKRKEERKKTSYHRPLRVYVVTELMLYDTLFLGHVRKSKDPKKNDKSKFVCSIRIPFAPAE